MAGDCSGDRRTQAILATESPELHPGITLGEGLNRPKGYREFLAGNKVDRIQALISQHEGREAWCSPHTWAGDKRAKINWKASIGIFVDLDYADHGVLPHEVGALTLESLRGIANLAYLTPHGVRAILVLDCPVTDPELFRRAALGASEMIAVKLAAANVIGLKVDLPATKDIARIFFVPNASVECRRGHSECKGKIRNADVIKLRDELWSVEALADAALSEKENGGKHFMAALPNGSPQGPTIKSGAELQETLLAAEGRECGRDVVFRCPSPNHLDKNPSARFDTTKQCWYCDVCKDGGGWMDLAKRRGIGIDFMINNWAHGSPSTTPSSSVKQKDERTSIQHQVNGDAIPLHKLVPKAIACLADKYRGEIFTRGSKLVQVTKGSRLSQSGVDRGSALRVHPLTDATLRLRLDGAAAWIKEHSGEGGVTKAKETLCPRAVVAAIRELGEWGALDPLFGIVEAPTMRANGTVVNQAGYDQSTGLLYEPSRTYPSIPESPTDAEVIAALGTLLGPFREFQLEGCADMASLLALLLTIAGRPAIEGPVPHWAVMSPSFGSGKTLLCEGVTLAMTGSAPDSMSPVGGRVSDAEAEMRKRVTSLVMEAPRVAIIDNIPDGDVLDSKVFASLLTASVWTDRLLGKNEKIHLPHRIVWLSTGCNFRLWGDIARRSLSIVIDPHVEDPHLRKFKVEDFLGHIREQHPSLLVAALTILRGYVVAGKPRHGHSLLGKFEAWDALIRGSAIWAMNLAGVVVDPLATVARLKDEAPDRSGLGELLEAWIGSFPNHSHVTAKQIIERSQKDPRLREAIIGVGGDRKGVPDARMIGNKLRVFANRVVAGASFCQDGKRQGSVLWKVHIGLTGESRESRESVGNPFGFLPGGDECVPINNEVVPNGLTRATGLTPSSNTHTENDDSSRKESPQLLNGQEYSSDENSSVAAEGKSGMSNQNVALEGWGGAA